MILETMASDDLGKSLMKKWLVDVNFSTNMGFSQQVRKMLPFFFSNLLLNCWSFHQLPVSLAGERLYMNPSSLASRDEEGRQDGVRLRFRCITFRTPNLRARSVEECHGRASICTRSRWALIKGNNYACFWGGKNLETNRVAWLNRRALWGVS